ncbi:acyltransferase [Geoglobus acetivorans]|uniref:Acyltransferase n=1 Tax=Geoglobus acetivorans TaxID=565033 RepID=A0A0A7GEP3_GEOAI|nr:acyltransferase [Geoglobus acetivorans]
MMEKLVIPPGVVFDETHIKHEGDVIVGNDSSIGFGIDARKIVVGDRATINGDLIGDEIRLDSWVKVKGDVLCRGDAFIGEFSSIEGKLTVHGNLEIGRNVRIEKGFEARGLITIQNPLPVIIFLFVYIMELLRLGKLDEVEELFSEEFENPLVIPDNTKLAMEQIRTGRNADFRDSKILGNVRAKNVIAENVELYGSLRGKDLLISGSKIHGAVEGRRVFIVGESIVYGSVSGEEVHIEKGCMVEGTIVGRKGVWIRDKVEAEIELEGEEEDDGLGEEEIQKDVSEHIQGT